LPNVLENWDVAPKVEVVLLEWVMLSADSLCDCVRLGVSPKRKNTVSFGEKFWSILTLVELKLLGDDVAIL
jgi:hypothetical protein